MAKAPVLSVVTVVLNAKTDFAFTLQSVAEQTYPHIEYVVVDGVSRDGTLEYAQANRQHIHTLISEKDNGFYDAMNKGLRAATGDYIVFMNAGDAFYAPDTVAQMFATAPDADLYYGDTVLIDDQFALIGPRDHKKLPTQLTYQDFRLGSVVCHQAFVPRRSLCPEYDLTFPGSADIEWSIVVTKRAKTIVNVRQVIARYKVGGLSAQHRWRYVKERFWIGVRHFGWPATLWDTGKMLVANALGMKV
jgi:glycosyltransferase involved in cell wall biosynthesis